MFYHRHKKIASKDILLNYKGKKIVMRNVEFWIVQLDVALDNFGKLHHGSTGSPKGGQAHLQKNQVLFL